MAKAIKGAAVFGTALFMVFPVAAPVHLGATDCPAELGTATWYGSVMHGRETASGEIFDMNGMTAAHRTLPLGSRVRVINLVNNKSVVVRITDRGPVSRSSIIDLSYGAAGVLNMRRRGRVRVRLEPVISGAHPRKHGHPRFGVNQAAIRN